MKGILLFLAASTTISTSARAQSAEPERPVVPFQDNSFLLEEAYNQDAGVVQHIFSMQRGKDNAMNSSLTQEWPVGSQRHQFSYQIPLVRLPGTTGTGLGDILVNYRLQAVGSADSKIAISPRLSLSLPTGRGARGRGSYGFGVGFPISYVVSPAIVTHTNFSVIHVPGAREADGRTGNAEYSVGQGVIFKAYPQAHAMLETLWTGGDTDSFIVSPGVRFALNFKSGLQIVPGFALPYETRSGGSLSYLFYLSFEHPFQRNPTGAQDSNTVK